MRSFRLSLARHLFHVPGRGALLGLCLLSACGAGGLTPSAGPVAATSPYGAYLIGRFAQDNDDLDIAASGLLATLAQDPTNATLANQAFLAAMLDDRPEALSLARALPASPMAQLLLGDDAARNGDWAAAAAHFGAVKAPGLSTYLTPLLIAWTQQGRSDSDGALATLAPHLQGPPLAGIYALNAGLIADLGNRYPDARKYYDLAAADFSNSNVRLVQILANWQARQGNTGDATETLRGLGTGDAALAIVVPGLIADLHTRPIAGAADGIADVYLSFAAELLQQNGNDTALAMLRLALDLRPDLTAARLLLANALAVGHHPREALRTLATVGNTDPLAPLVRLRRAALEDGLGDYDIAEAGLRQLATDYPSASEPLAELADVQRDHNELPQSIATYTGAIARPDGAASWLLFFDRATSEQQGGDWPKAEGDLRHALDLAPDQPEVMNFLGYTWADRNEHLAAAHDLIARAAVLRPNDGAIVDSLGWVQLRQGDVTDAVKSLERAVQMEPEDAEINGHLGDAYWAAGLKLQARYQWQLALNFKPDAAAARVLQGKLEQALRATGATRAGGTD